MVANIILHRPGYSSSLGYRTTPCRIGRVEIRRYLCLARHCHLKNLCTQIQLRLRSVIISLCKGLTFNANDVLRLSGVLMEASSNFRAITYLDSVVSEISHREVFLYSHQRLCKQFPTSLPKGSRIVQSRPSGF